MKLVLSCPRPICMAPVAAQGVVNATGLPCGSPLTYSWMVWACASYTPSRCVHAPTAGLVVATERTIVGDATSEVYRLKIHFWYAVE